MTKESESAQHRNASERIVIQKYANRRLYNKATSSYITLDDLSTMVKEGVDFVVHDAKSGEDITRKVLTQIIFEEEGRGQNLLPIQFLRQLIGFYGDRMQAFLPSFLELSLDSFIRQQERLQGPWTSVAPPSMGAFDEQIRQNMALFERAMKMFTPFAYRADEIGRAVAGGPPTKCRGFRGGFAGRPEGPNGRDAGAAGCPHEQGIRLRPLRPPPLPSAWRRRRRRRLRFSRRRGSVPGPPVLQTTPCHRRIPGRRR